jgi:hypothetical protein
MHTRTIALGIAAMTLAGQAAAQRPTKEFGVDLAITSTGTDEGNSDRLLSIGTPVDVRIGFLTSPRLSIEPRFTLSYQSISDESLMEISPSFNVLLGLGKEAHRGPYVMAGALIDLARADFGSGDASSRTQLGFNLGFGTRIGWGDNAAFRPEVFFTKKLEKGDVFDDDYAPATTAFGVRFGISFFH